MKTRSMPWRPLTATPLDAWLQDFTSEIEDKWQRLGKMALFRTFFSNCLSWVGWKTTCTIYIYILYTHDWESVGLKWMLTYEAKNRMSLLRWVAETVWLSIPVMTATSAATSATETPGNVCRTLRRSCAEASLQTASFAVSLWEAWHRSLLLGIWKCSKALQIFVCWSNRTIFVFRPRRSRAKQDLLPRLLLRWVELLNERPILANGFELVSKEHSSAQRRACKWWRLKKTIAFSSAKTCKKRA